MLHSQSLLDKMLIVIIEHNYIFTVFAKQNATFTVIREKMLQPLPGKQTGFDVILEHLDVNMEENAVVNIIV